MSSATISKKSYLLVWAALMVLLGATWGVAELNLGAANTILALIIAVIKMGLVIFFFMHVRYNNRLTWIFAGAGFVWFWIMVSLTMTDYLTRGWLRAQDASISYWQEGAPTPPPGGNPGDVNTTKSNR